MKKLVSLVICLMVAVGMLSTCTLAADLQGRESVTLGTENVEVQSVMSRRCEKWIQYQSLEGIPERIYAEESYVINGKVRVFTGVVVIETIENRGTYYMAHYVGELYCYDEV